GALAATEPLGGCQAAIPLVWIKTEVGPARCAEAGPLAGVTLADSTVGLVHPCEHSALTVAEHEVVDRLRRHLLRRERGHRETADLREGGAECVGGHRIARHVEPEGRARTPG